MSILYKLSSGLLTEATLVHTGPCFYFGFVCEPGGADKTIDIFDGLTDAGLAIENFTADGDKTTDGHSHSTPVRCLTGLYVKPAGGITVVYYLPR